MTDKSRYHAKLSKEQIEKIKEYLTCGLPIKQEWIANQFKVDQSLIAYYNRKIKLQRHEQKA